VERTTAALSKAHLATERAVRSARRDGARAGLLMVAPVVLLVAMFTVYPFAHAIYESLQLSSPILPPRFVGLDNYRDVITSPYVLDAVRATALFTVFTVPILVVLGLLVALLLNERFLGNRVLRVGMLLPWAIPASVTGIIWKWVFLDSWGALNALLYATGIVERYVPWLTTPTLAVMAVVIAFVWAQLPLAAVFLLAALQAVPDQLYEAAAIDGADALGRFQHVTLPGVRPMLVIVALYEMLMALTSFDITYSLTHGGPGTATTMLTYFTWSESFKMLNFGNGSALAIVTALASLLAIFAILRALPRDALLGEAR
jgi:multiple sugar transport system permease protein